MQIVDHGVQGEINGVGFMKSVVPENLNEWYRQVCEKPSDINLHLPVLRHYAEKCNRVMEFGTRGAVSTVALLSAQPDTLVCYDLVRSPTVDILKRLAGRTRFQFVLGSTLEAPIEDTDFLFIDTLHTQAQISAEIGRAEPHVGRFMAFHDVETFGRVDEKTKEHGGILAPIERLVSGGRWRVVYLDIRNNGLMILQRK